SPLGRGDGILADPLPRLLRLREHCVQNAAELVHSRGRGASGLDGVKQLVEVGRADCRERQGAYRSRENVLTQTLPLTAAARFRAAMVEPPGVELCERPGQVLRS